MVQPTFLGLAPHRPWAKALAVLLGMPLLLGVWAISFEYFHALSVTILAPWSGICCITAALPAGDSQIPIDEFFESRPTEYLVPALLLICVIIAFLFRLMRVRERILLPLLLALFNAAFLVLHALFLVITGVVLVVLNLAPSWPPSYISELPLIAVLLIGLVLLPVMYSKIPVAV